MFCLLILIFGCGNSNELQPNKVETPTEIIEQPTIWPLQHLGEKTLIAAGTDIGLVVESPLTLISNDMIVGGARIVEAGPELSSIEITQLAAEVSTDGIYVRARLPEDTPILAALQTTAPKAIKPKNTTVVPISNPDPIVEKTNIEPTLVIPNDLKYGTADTRIEALIRYENNPSATAIIIWSMKNDPDFEVRKKAWRVIRARWNRGTGVPSEHDSAASWMASNGPSDLRVEAIAAIGRTTSLSKAGKYINDSDPNVRVASADAICETGLRTNQIDKTREMIADRLSKEEDEWVIKSLTKDLKKL